MRSSSRNRPPSRATAWDGDPKISATVTEYLLPLSARQTSSSRAPFVAGDTTSSRVSPRAAPAAEGSACGNEPPKNKKFLRFRPGPPPAAGPRSGHRTQERTTRMRSSAPDGEAPGAGGQPVHDVTSAYDGQRDAGEGRVARRLRRDDAVAGHIEVLGAPHPAGRVADAGPVVCGPHPHGPLVVQRAARRKDPGGLAVGRTAEDIAEPQRLSLPVLEDREIPLAERVVDR